MALVFLSIPTRKMDSDEQCEDSLPRFLKIFSLSANFDYVLNALEIKYRSNPLSEDMSGTRVKYVSSL
jgi:hypothetical protein